MGEVRSNEWYDAAYAADANYRCAAHESTFAPLWLEIARRVPDGAAVLDLGCGPAHVAEFLDRKVTCYDGIDFSAEAVDLARRRFKTLHDGRSFHATVGDVRDAQLRRRDVYLACELLEHLDDDLALIGRLPPGRLIASVPKHDSEGHVRHFGSIVEVAERYKSALGGIIVSECGENWFIVEGRTS